MAYGLRASKELPVPERYRPGKWWAWEDLNFRPRPYQSSVVRFYNNLQDRGGCQTTRKSNKTSHVVGWVVGWKKFHGPRSTPTFVSQNSVYGKSLYALSIKGRCFFLPAAATQSPDGYPAS